MFVEKGLTSVERYVTVVGLLVHTNTPCLTNSSENPVQLLQWSRMMQAINYETSTELQCDDLSLTAGKDHYYLLLKQTVALVDAVFNNTKFNLEVILI